MAGKFKKELMVIVNFQLDRIHATYALLKYSKLIPCNCLTCINSQEPYFYPFDELREFYSNEQMTIQCRKKPYHMVNVLNLIDGTIGKNQLVDAELRRFSDTALEKVQTKPVALLVTVTKYESQALLNVFFEATGNKAKQQFIDDKTYYDLGVINNTQIYLVQSEMGAIGPGAAFMTIVKGIKALSPSAVIMVGIAFGINAKLQKIGDILVSRQISSYEQQKIKEKIIPRGDRVTASTALIDIFRSGDLIDWKGPKVHFGLILSGEKLIDDLTFRNRVTDLEPEAIGGEMEGAGLYAAANDAKVDWILVKAICDWADGNKTENKLINQKLAAFNAAKFTLHVIKQGGLAELSSFRKRK